jgi:hypothetical protein
VSVLMAQAKVDGLPGLTHLKDLPGTEDLVNREGVNDFSVTEVTEHSMR